MASPSSEIARRLKDSGVSITEIYSEYSSLKNQINRLTSENARLSDAVDVAFKDIEKYRHKLELEQKEVERIKKEADKLVKELDKVYSERNSLRAKTERVEGENTKLKVENKSLTRGNSDLCRQIQELLKNIEGVSNFNADASLDMDMTDSEQIISERLVVFRNITVRL